MVASRTTAVTATGSVSAPVSRTTRITATGTLVTAPQSRTTAITATGGVAIFLTPPASVRVEPVGFTVTATLGVGSPAPTTWTWAQVSGPTATLTPSGSSCIISPPDVMPPEQDMVFTVQASNGSSSSSAYPFTVTVLPQTRWTRVPGGQWKGAY